MMLLRNFSITISFTSEIEKYFDNMKFIEIKNCIISNPSKLKLSERGKTIRKKNIRSFLENHVCKWYFLECIQYTILDQGHLNLFLEGVLRIFILN